MAREVDQPVTVREFAGVHLITCSGLEGVKTLIHRSVGVTPCQKYSASHARVLAANGGTAHPATGTESTGASTSPIARPSSERPRSIKTSFARAADWSKPGMLSPEAVVMKASARAATGGVSSYVASVGDGVTRSGRAVGVTEQVASSRTTPAMLPRLHRRLHQSHRAEDAPFSSRSAELLPCCWPARELALVGVARPSPAM